MKKFLPIIALIALSFVACTSAGPEATAPTEEAIDSNNQPETITSADELLDQEIYNRATANLSTELCADIMDVEKQNECSDVVISIIKTNEALNNNDKSNCQEIPLKRFKEDCITQVSEKSDSVAMEEKENTERELVEKLQQGKNLDGCYALSFEYLKEQCITNISFGLATFEMDATYCQNISDSNLKDNCIKSANEASLPVKPEAN